MSLSGEELERYARHIVLREIGGPGQQRLRRARVLVVGAGGLGSPILMYLAAAGVGHLGVVDDDTVSLSNLQRQIIFDTGRIGAPKVAGVAEAIGRINPHVTVAPLNMRLTGANSGGIVRGHDLVLDGCDNFQTRYTVNAACHAEGIPLISGAMTQWEGQVSLFDPARGGPCYACIFPDPPEPGLAPPCAEAGVIGALPGIIGSMMALEAIKHIARAGETLRDTLLLYDALTAGMRKIRLRPTPGCSVCGGSGGGNG